MIDCEYEVSQNIRKIEETSYAALVQTSFLYNLFSIAVLSLGENTIKFLGIWNFKHDEFSMFSQKPETQWSNFHEIFNRRDCIHENNNNNKTQLLV